MEPTPVPRTPVSQRIGAAAAAESKEDAADAGATVHAQQDCVDTWSTDKIETFAPAAEQMIVVRNVGKPHWKVFRTMSILLLTSRARIYEHYMEGGNNKANGQGVLIKPPQKSVAFVLVCAGVALCALSKPGGHQEAVPSLARLASDDEQLSILPGCYEL